MTKRELFAILFAAMVAKITCQDCIEFDQDMLLNSGYSIQSTVVSLSYMNICKLDADTFKGMTKLNKLILSHNKLDSLDPRTFNGLNSLNYLDISNNQLGCRDNQRAKA